MKRATPKQKKVKNINFTPAEKGVIKRLRNYAHDELVFTAFLNNKNYGHMPPLPTQAEIDEAYAKKLAVWLINRFCKDRLTQS